MKRLVSAIYLLTLCGSLAAAAKAWQLNSRGYGPVKVGMTIAEAESAMGTKLHTLDDQGNISDRPPWDECDFVYPSKDSRVGVYMMVQGGRISHISAKSKEIHTPSGVRLGDAASKIRRLFGARLEIEGHHYLDNAFYYFVWETNRHYGVKFEIVDDTVESIDAGDQTIMLVEGCS